MKKVVFYAVSAFVLGGCVGYLIGTPDFPSDSLSGDISKVNRHKKEVVSEQSTVLFDRLTNDTEFRANTLSALEVLSNNANIYCAALACANEASKDVKALAAAQHNSSELLSNIIIAANTINSAKESILNLNVKTDVEALLNSASVAASFVYNNATKQIAAFSFEADKALSNAINKAELAFVADAAKSMSMAYAVREQDLTIYNTIKESSISNRNNSAKVSDSFLNSAYKSSALSNVMSEHQFNSAIESLNNAVKEMSSLNLTFDKDKLVLGLRNATNSINVDNLNSIMQISSAQNAVTFIQDATLSYRWDISITK